MSDERCTITRADDGWTLDLRMRFDTLAGIQTVMDAADAAGWDGDVRVTIPKAEPEPEWDGVFRVGDEGVTVGGEPYAVKSTNAEYMTRDGKGGKVRQPLLVEFCGVSQFYNADGTYWGYARADSSDLMPPTKRGPKV